MSLTLDDDSAASTPGRLRISPWRWALRYPKWPALLGVALLVAVAHAALTGSAKGWAGVVLLAVANGVYWQRIREHFTDGCVNPAVVVGLDPIRLAVLTDLTKGIGYFPVVKVIEEPPSSRWPPTLH